MVFVKKKMCYGFKNAYFSGLTSLELAKIIYKFVLKKQLIKRGLYNLSGPKINKFELLNIIKNIYKKNIDILEENQFRIDRSLNSNKFIKLTKYKKLEKNVLEYKNFMINSLFKNKIILVTGGTGSFGSAFINKIIKSRFKEIEFLADEKKQKI